MTDLLRISTLHAYSQSRHLAVQAGLERSPALANLAAAQSSDALTALLLAANGGSIDGTDVGNNSVGAALSGPPAVRPRVGWSIATRDEVESGERSTKRRRRDDIATAQLAMPAYMALHNPACSVCGLASLPGLTATFSSRSMDKSPPKRDASTSSKRTRRRRIQDLATGTCLLCGGPIIPGHASAHSDIASTELEAAQRSRARFPSVRQRERLHKAVAQTSLSNNTSRSKQALAAAKGPKKGSQSTADLPGPSSASSRQAWASPSIASSIQAGPTSKPTAAGPAIPALASPPPPAPALKAKAKRETKSPTTSTSTSEEAARRRAKAGLGLRPPANDKDGGPPRSVPAAQVQVHAQARRPHPPPPPPSSSSLSAQAGGSKPPPPPHHHHHSQKPAQSAKERKKERAAALRGLLGQGQGTANTKGGPGSNSSSGGGGGGGGGGKAGGKSSGGGGGGGLASFLSLL